MNLLLSLVLRAICTLPQLVNAENSLSIGRCGVACMGLDLGAREHHELMRGQPDIVVHKVVLSKDTTMHEELYTLAITTWN